MATKVTVVSGSTRTGVYAPDGSINVVVLTNPTSPVGIYNACGAFNVVLTATLTSMYHSSGAYNAVDLGGGSYAFGLWLSLSTGGGSGPTMMNVVTGAATNFSTMTLAANATQGGFKGRRLYKLASGLSGVTGLTFAFWNWRTNGSNGAGVAEVTGTVAIPVNKAYAVLRDSSLAQRGNGIAVTKGGSRSFTIPVSTDRFDFDEVTPAQFGVSSFNDGDYIEFRWWFTLANGQNTYRMVTVHASQGWRFDETQLIDDIDSAAVMTVGASRSEQPITFPNVVLARRSQLSGFKSRAMCGDSISYNQNTISNTTDARVGASYPTKGAFQAGKASFNVSIGGRTLRGMLNSPLTLAAIKDVCNSAHLAYGTNDIAFATALTQLEADYREASLLMKGWGWSSIGASSLPPRTTEGTVNNTTNLYCATDLTQMQPYITQALAANGFPRDGYGFGAGESRDQWNTTKLPGLLADGTVSYIVDLASVCQDPTTTWKWKVPAYSSTLTAAAASGAISVQLGASPPVGTNLVIEPGVANVEPVQSRQGGPVTWSVTGSGPYTASVIWNNSYNGGAAVNTSQLAAAHASGSVVKATLSGDQTHPSTIVHDDTAALMATALNNA